MPIVGFYYLSSKNHDGKSFSMATQLIFVLWANNLVQTNYLLSAIFIYISSIILLVGFFGGFDGLFRKKAEPKDELMEEEITAS